MEQIPTEVMEKIQERTIQYANESGYIKQIAIPAYNDGAYFGYRLLCEGKEKEIAELKGLAAINDGFTKLIESQSQRISELEAEKERLKGLIKDAFYYKDDSPGDGWLFSKFKTENNL